MIEQVLVNDENIDFYKDFVDEYFQEGSQTTIDGYLFKIVEKFGGDGFGVDYWIVFSVEKEEEIKHYRIDGWYASYDGRELDPMDYRLVKPVEKTIIVWE